MINQDHKATAIGDIPPHWEVAKIGEIADVKGGKRLPKGSQLSVIKNSHPYIRVADMYMGGVSTNHIQYVPDDVFKFIAKYTINSDDLFISVAGTIGIVGFVPKELDGANLTENANKLTNISINKVFLFYVMSSDIVQNIINKEKTNNAQPKLALTRIREFIIPNPPLNEQQKISKILSTVDEKLDNISKQISETEKLKKGLMQQLLTKGIGHDKFKSSELGEIPENWEVKELNNVTFHLLFLSFLLKYHAATPQRQNCQNGEYQLYLLLSV